MTKNPTLPLAAALALASSALATPSGLNNIPTADTIDHRTVAVQAFSSFGPGANQFAANGPDEHSFWMGFKTGWDLTSQLHLEWGLDSPLFTHESGPLLFQTKLGFEPWEKAKLAVGIAGIALTDINRAGDPFSYAVLSQDLGLVRAHVGYGVQTNGHSFLFGLDRNWKIFDRTFNLNADLVQAADQAFWLPALGWKYEVTPHVVLEWWSNFPEQGQSSHIAKINFVFHF
jgi:hypothetical protein